MPNGYSFQPFCDKFSDGNEKWGNADAIRAVIDCQLPCVCWEERKILSFSF